MTRRRSFTAALLGCTLLGTALAGGATAAAPAAPTSAAARTSVVVQATDVATARTAVTAAGGTVTRTLPIVSGVAAELPAAAVSVVRGRPGVRAVTADTALEPMTYSDALGYDPETNVGSMYQIAAMTGAHGAFKAGYSGKGVDVALIDSGVAPVQGLTSGNVVNGPDLSFDSQEPNLQHGDSFGHGTHMASIINGRDVAQARASGYIDANRFNGMAPDARLVNVKVAASDGATDVSQVLAALNWVVENRNRDGLNIRVVNLSYGTDSTQDYRLDPLAHAVEAAWRAGIFVVVSGGNDGSTRDYLGMPAQDPLIMAVGAQDPMGTARTGDDTVPAWASKGATGAHKRHVDLVAPGVSVLGLRSPNSMIDYDNPHARTGTRFLRGNGTSQSAAVVSGAAALFLQRYPQATPDEVKRALTQAASAFPNTPEVYRGAGALDVHNAIRGAVPNNSQNSTPSTGTGSLELSRGSVHVVDYADDTTATPTVLTGETDIFGSTFDAPTWATRTTLGTTWLGGDWLGRTWSGDSWSGSSWAGRTWSGRTWSATNWAGRTWSGRTWSGRTWSADGWDGRTWSGRTWSGRTWSGRTWSGDTWSGVGWQ